MSTEYTKTNWQDGDIITADKMNNIENGIKELEEVGTTLKDDLVYKLTNGVAYRNNVLDGTDTSVEVIKRFVTTSRTTSASNIMCFEPVMYKGLYRVYVPTTQPLTLYVFGVASDSATALTLLNKYDVSPINGIVDTVVYVSQRSVLGFAGVVNYALVGEGTSEYYTSLRNVTYANSAYTRASTYFQICINASVLSVVHTFDDYGAIKTKVAPMTQLLTTHTASNYSSRFLCFGSVLEAGTYYVKLHSPSYADLLVFNADSIDDTSVTLENTFQLASNGTYAERYITIKNPSLLGIHGPKIDTAVNNSTYDGYEWYYYYPITNNNGTYTISRATNYCNLNIEVYKVDDYESLYEEKYNPAQIATSDETLNIKLIGNSITQGSGSTGYVEFTSGGIIYRGNAPDYPDAGADYQVGDFLGSTSEISWYEAIDGSGWGQLFKAYAEDKFNCTVKNYGMGGATTSQILSNIGTLISDDDDVVFVMMGTNDRKFLSLATFESNMRTIVNTILNAGKKAVLITPIPISVSAEASSTYFHMEDAANVTSGVAADANVPCIELFNDITNYALYTGTDVDALLNGDGIHPNDNGYKLLFRFITQGLGLSIKRDGATW